MNTRRAVFLQSIRGPILLITLGILFAIHQAGVLSFSRTWPLLIIVIGIMKLLERSSGAAPAFQGEYPGRGAQGSYPSNAAYPQQPWPPQQQPPAENPLQTPPGGDVK